MSKFLIFLSLILFSLCMKRTPNFDKQKLIKCLKDDNIEYNDLTKELRALYDADRLYLFYKRFYESKLEEYMKYQMMYCFGEYGLKLRKVSTYQNCLDKCKDTGKNCNCKK